MGTDEHVLERLDREECLRLLATVPVGRFVFTLHGLPAVQPVNFVVDRGRIVFRTREGCRLVAAREGTVVAFEADDIDVATSTGWSVTVVGKARILDAPEAAAYRGGITDALAGGGCEDVVVMTTSIVDGRRIRNQPGGLSCFGVGGGS